jgi:LytS/YehU family sensor histidine kinase
LKIEFDIPASIPDKSIVPVTLQVLIENAMKHNRIDEQFPLRIEIKITNDDLWVSNNLQPRKTVDSNKQGLENLKSLYQFFSERPVVIEQTDKQFSIRVPLI